MTPIELKVLKYINKRTKLPESEILSHFSKYDDVMIDAIIFLLYSNGYIREHNKVITITDRGQIEAESERIISGQKWKDRIVGFILGVATTVVAGYLLSIIGI